MNGEKLLEVKNLEKVFKLGKQNSIKAVHGISFDIYKGEIFGLVGESGSGKSTTGKNIMQIVEPTRGEIYYKGFKISDKTIYRKHRKELSKSMQMIFQDAAAAVNPRMTIAEIVSEPLKIQGHSKNKTVLRGHACELMERVGLNTNCADRYPAEFSGGQLQRVCIARALALDPEFIIADEPIASLDVSIQAQVVNLFKKLQKEGHLTCLFIAHDLAMVRYISDRIGVMYRGHLVEVAESNELYNNPIHPYTKSLLSAIPVPDPEVAKKHIALYYHPEPEPEKLIWKEISPGHFVYLMPDEIKHIDRIIKK
ncbi:MAG: ATP-binding cassette domain-containing protein [Eubacterium sp.]